jgi:hypothetical protein
MNIAIMSKQHMCTHLKCVLLAHVGVIRGSVNLGDEVTPENLFVIAYALNEQQSDTHMGCPIHQEPPPPLGRVCCIEYGDLALSIFDRKQRYGKKRLNNPTSRDTALCLYLSRLKPD